MHRPQSMIVDNAQKILHQVRKVVVGKDKVLMWTLATILAGGHILLIFIPKYDNTPVFA